jgi:hypothetical protein
MAEGSSGPGSTVPASQPVTDVGVVRYGPGVPASQAGAESVWRTGERPGPPGRHRGRRRRLRQTLGLALTVILLIAAGVVLWLRFHHAPFHVTDVRIASETSTGCGVDVTGRIDTNGSAGTVSYQWVFRPSGNGAPQPLNQSVVAGQHAAYVTVAVEGRGHGSATQTVILQVLGPDTGTAFRTVTVSC